MHANLRSLLASTALVSLFGCADCNDGGSTPEEAPAPTATPVGECAECGSPTNNETMQPRPYDPPIYYHLAEGSELIPLVWLKALNDFSSGSDAGPFLDDIERFGLLPDPNATCQIPVGLTGLHSGDPRFMGIRMTGITCAACHVGEVTLGDETIRIAGGPNLFDTVKFLHDAGTSARYTATHLSEFFEFVGRALTVDCGPTPQGMPTFELGPRDIAEEEAQEIRDLTREFFETYPTLDELRAAGDFEQALADQLESLVVREEKSPPPEMLDWTDLSRDGPYREYRREWAKSATQPFANLGLSPDMEAQRHEFRDEWLGSMILPEPLDLEPAQGNPFAAIPRGVQFESAQRSFLSSWWRALRLLWARVKFLERLAAGSSQPSTWAGFGRVDAFGSARINIFGQDVALNAPVNYPFLWGMGKRPWYHWDGDTDSLRERNVGQALALGAVYDDENYDSTVLFENLLTLEAMSRGIDAPAWPFGTPESAAVAKGEEIFDTECAGCHPRLDTHEEAPLKRIALDVIGTDPERAVSFAKPVDGECFPAALKTVVEKIMAAGGQPAENAVWCAPEEYDSWPLYGVWATAPYLHNGSVLSVRELLKKPDERASAFYVGTRDYDVANLGYQDVEDPVRPLMIHTSQTGNAATGHDFGTDLSDEKKDALIEFLKTL